VVTEAKWELQEFHRAWADESLPAPVAATHLRSAIVALEEMIGVIDADDILDQVFSTFCVGK
jgi:tRNA modification GTPase